MRLILFFPLCLAAGLVSCEKKEAQAAAKEPVAVSYLELSTKPVTLSRELPGRIDAIRVAEVRARVSGILMEKVFDEGADVEAGQDLFLIDPAPLEAARDKALADLAKWEASLAQAKSQLTRYQALSGSSAVSQQDLDNVAATVQVGEAEIMGAKAALQTAELNLSYARVTSPIAGRVGRAQVTEGALVGQGQATLLATVQQLDPIYFDFTQSSTEMLKLQKAMEAGSLTRSEDQGQATLILEDGSEYGHQGKLLFSEAVVDQSTGMVTLRAEFPNPDKVLLPGMFARGRLSQGTIKEAITVPQRAVTRARAGVSTVLVVKENNELEERKIQTADALQDQWLVTDGLKAGERIVMEGHLKARHGDTVVPEPWQPVVAKEESAE